jgi:hypothetical protein
LLDEKNGTNDEKLRLRIRNLLSRPLVEVEEAKTVEEEGEKEKTPWEKYKEKAFPPRDLFNINKFTSLYMDLPFYEVISDLQSARIKHPKGTIQNLLYKEMGNSLYGSVSKGLSNKMKYDIKMGKTVRMEAGALTNPIMASHITASVRSLIGVFLSKIEGVGGKAVSVTTDGFITDCSELETKIVTSVSDIEARIEDSKNILYKCYSEIREDLSGDRLLLELKHEGKNLISWTTRGQVSTEMKLRASTGIQTHGLDSQEFESLIKEGLNSPSKTISFVSTNLSSLKNIVKDSRSVTVKEIDSRDGFIQTENGIQQVERGTYVTKSTNCHVTMQYRDQDFRLLYNNNRQIVDIDAASGLMGTKPFGTVEECLQTRLKGNVIKGTIYQKNSSLPSISKYKSLLDLGVREFIKYIFRAGL